MEKPTEKAVQWRVTVANEAKRADVMIKPADPKVNGGADHEEMTMLMFSMQRDEAEMSNAEEILYDALSHIDLEYACDGAGIGGGFTDTSELHVMKREEAMHTANKNEVFV